MRLVGVSKSGWRSRIVRCILRLIEVYVLDRRHKRLRSRWLAVHKSAVFKLLHVVGGRVGLEVSAWMVALQKVAIVMAVRNHHSVGMPESRA